jgi:hypothetical protein
MRTSNSKSETGNQKSKTLNLQINARESEPVTCNMQPVTAPTAPQPSIFNFQLSAAGLGQRMRNGKIARLPKLERDLVNKLLHNHIPYSKIVLALGERGITVTERNISNWRTRGGYKEWCAEQDNQLRLAHLQDHLTDYLRKHDAQQLPEVGLQIASTQLTTLLMNPQTAAPLLADPNKYARVVDALDKCSARLKKLQNYRYKNVRRASIRDSVQNIRCEEAREVEVLREIASAQKLGDSIHEEDTPHRNDLPAREELPYDPPGPTFGQLLELRMQERLEAKKASEASSKSQTAAVPSRSRSGSTPPQTNPARNPLEPAATEDDAWEELSRADNVDQTTPFGNQTETHGNSRQPTET